MTFINDSIKEAHKTLSIPLVELDEGEAGRLREDIEKKYSDKNGNLPLWERLVGGLSFLDSDGWKTTGAFPYSDKVIMFFDRRNETAMYYLNSGSDVVKVLSECPGFVFYLTDKKCSFLLCFNDHDYLIGAGYAKEWIWALDKNICEAPLTLESFNKYPVWKWNDSTDGYIPELNWQPLKKVEATYFIKSLLTSADGHDFDGYLVGVGIDTYYAFGVFVKDEEFVINLNLPDLASQSVEAIRKKLGLFRLEFFPLKYKSEVCIEGNEIIEGEFS